MKHKINRPNRNIKPLCHGNNEIKVLWNITSDLSINRKHVEDV